MKDITYAIQVIDGYNINQAKDLFVLNNDDVDGDKSGGEGPKANDAVIRKWKEAKGIPFDRNYHVGIFQKDVVLGKDDIPDDYIWDSTRDSSLAALDGSLKDSSYLVKHTFQSTDSADELNFAVYGNYHKLSLGSDFPFIIREGLDPATAITGNMKRHNVIAVIAASLFFIGLVGLVSWIVSLLPNKIDLFSSWGPYFNQIQSALNFYTNRLSFFYNLTLMFDGSSIEGFVRIKEADMYLHPDLSTWLILDFEDTTYGKVARLICDVYTPYGKPFVGDPRFILKKMVKKMNDMGFSALDVGFEPEFFLFKLDDKGNPIMLVGLLGFVLSLKSIREENNDKIVRASFLCYVAIGYIFAAFFFINATFWYTLIGKSSIAWWIVVSVILFIAALIASNVPMMKMLEDADSNIILTILTSTLAVISFCLTLTLGITWLVTMKSPKDVAIINKELMGSPIRGCLSIEFRLYLHPLSCFLGTQL